MALTVLCSLLLHAIKPNVILIRMTNNSAFAVLMQDRDLGRREKVMWKKSELLIKDWCSWLSACISKGAWASRWTLFSLRFESIVCHLLYSHSGHFHSSLACWSMKRATSELPELNSSRFWCVFFVLLIIGFNFKILKIYMLVAQVGQRNETTFTSLQCLQVRIMRIFYVPPL